MRKMMKCAAAWVLAFAVALTAVPVAYAEDAAGNPETENTVPDEAVKEAATVDQESLNDQAGQDDQNPDSTEGSVLETEDEKAGAEENAAQQTTPGEGVETENPAAVDPAVESEEQTQPAEDAQAEAVQQQTETDVQEKATPETEQEAVLPELTYRTHVQDIGWQSWKQDGEMAGTSGLYKRLEAIELKLSKSDYEGSIEYQTHVQNIGWQGWKRDGQLSGTQARALRLEAIRIRLTGEIAEYYDIYYRVHIQNYGWLPYVKNGAAAGSEAFGLRLEGIEVKLVKKDEGTAPAVGYGFLKNVLYYSGHVQTLGNVKEVKSGSVLGTVGQYKRMEALSVRLKGMDGYASGNIRYQAHVQNIGWQGWKQNGSSAGTTGKALRLEAVQIQLDGEIAQIYDVYYRVHVQNYGWLGWAKNGAVSGTSGFGYRMEAIQIQLVPKGWKAPGSTAHAYLKNYTNNDLTYSGHVQNVGNVAAVKGGATLGTVGKGRRLEGFSINLNDSADGLAKGSIQYRAHVQDIGWQGWKQEGTLAGTTGQGKRMEAVQIRLTGELASYYHVYYRVHSQYFGWLGWAKDGESAGTSSLSLRIEAIQIKLVPKKDSQSAYQTGKAYYNTYRYQNPKQYLQIRHVQKTLSGGGYNLSRGYMGLKVWYVQRKLGLSGRRAIMDSTTINAVRNYQRRSGLSATGVVDLATWKKMGYSESAWYHLGAYASPLKTNPASTRSDCIEAMISTAYQYLGNPYIIGASGDPNHGLDCSGLVMQALYSAGIDPAPVSPIRHSRPGYEYECRNLWNLPMKHVPYSQRQRGDLIFYKSANGTIIHVAIYLGNNRVIESWPNKVVVWPVQNSHRSLIAGVARPFV